MEGKSAFKRGPWNTLKILISVLKHSAEHVIVKLLQGVAQDELLIKTPLPPVLPTHPDFMGVGVGVGWVPVLFTYCSFHASGKVGGPMFGAHVSGREDTPQTPRTRPGGENAVTGGIGSGALCSSWKPNGHDFAG